MSHLIEMSNITTRANNQFPRPDFHRLDKQPYRLQPLPKGGDDSFPCTPAVLRGTSVTDTDGCAWIPAFLPRRDLNHETGPNGDIVFHVNIALVVGDDSACDGESEACTASFRGEIR